MSRIHDALRRAAEAPDTELVEQPILLDNVSPRETAAQPDLTLSYRSISLQSVGAVLPFQGRDSYASEQYRLIRTRILQHEKKPKVIAVSSPASGDGKTISAINIAAALSLTKRVALLDGDFRCSKIHTALGLENSQGLADVLAGKAKLEQAINRNEQFPQLFVMLSGIETANAAELFGSPAWPAVCESLRRQFDYIVVDTPPIGAVADYELIQKEMDGIVFVVRPDQTKKSACTGALAMVPREKLLGAVINCAAKWGFWRTQYGYSEYTKYHNQDRAAN
jgi:capsular exopolysaccharide synthesis family protein